MQRAFREAKRWQHDFVGTEHLLYGLLCDADGSAVMLLRSLNANPDLLLDKVEISLQQHGACEAMEQFPLSPASRRVLRNAGDEAGQFRNHLIGPEHLLLSMLREKECEAGQLLANHGVEWTAVRDALAKLPRDVSPETQVHGDAGQRFELADNPSADELERWFVDPADSHVTTPDADWSAATVVALHGYESQVRNLQILLGGMMGYGFGMAMSGWLAAIVIGLIGMGVGGAQRVGLGILFGLACGIATAFSGRVEVFGLPGDLVLHSTAGVLFGTLLGDAGRLKAYPEHQPPAPDVGGRKDEPDYDVTEDRERNGDRSRQ
jgi:ATP-dependent Clp protease ATP-binding subunit ClpC